MLRFYFPLCMSSMGISQKEGQLTLLDGVCFQQQQFVHYARISIVYGSMQLNELIYYYLCALGSRFHFLNSCYDHSFFICYVSYLIYASLLGMLFD